MQISLTLDMYCWTWGKKGLPKQHVNKGRFLCQNSIINGWNNTWRKRQYFFFNIFCKYYFLLRKISNWLDFNFFLLIFSATRPFFLTGNRFRGEKENLQQFFVEFLTMGNLSSIRAWNFIIFFFTIRSFAL